METVDSVSAFLEAFAPPELAEEWDNVGLLVGDRGHSVSRVMTCLTLTPASVSEAIDNHAQLVVTHHPLPFKPLKRLTTESTPGRLLWQLIRAGVSVYSPHTAFDSTAAGINQRLAELLGLTGIAPLTEIAGAPEHIGVGRWGKLPEQVSLAQFVVRVKQALGLERLEFVGSDSQTVATVAVGCGSAGQFLDAAIRRQCSVFLTGETNFHTCLEAEARGVGLVLVGHYASERFAVEQLAALLAERFPKLHVWASQQERNPLRCG